MSDTGAVDAAIVNRLAGDATLIGLLPDGVWISEAPAGKQAFAIVSLIVGRDIGQMAPLPDQQRRALEDLTYLVKAVTLGTSRTKARQAAARIDVLLEDQPLTITGYGFLSSHRMEPIEDTEPDAIDQSIRWQHYGGRYRVLVTPTAIVSPTA